MLRVYLDEDIPIQVKEKIEKYAQVVTTPELGWRGMKDCQAYPHAVREGFDLIVTCNTEGREAFLAENLRHLACRVKDLPIPVYELHEPKSNHWPKLERRWKNHEARIKQELTDLGQKHERRRAAAIEKLDRLEKTAQRTRPQMEVQTRNTERIKHEP